MKFTVNRSNWIRGTYTSRLVDVDGKQDITGFYAAACGVSRDELETACSISELCITSPNTDLSLLKGLFDESGKVSYHLHNLEALNDYDFLSKEIIYLRQENNLCHEVKIESEEVRERLITEEFATFGVEVEFI